LAVEPTEIEEAGGGLRGRLLRGARGQIFANVVRVVVQLGSVAILLPVWGVDRFGEWLILIAIPSYLASSDLGFFAAAGNDIVMATARGAHEHACDVFRATARGAAIVFGVLAMLLALVCWLLPISTLLNLTMPESTASLALLLLMMDTLLITFSGLLTGGFASAGYQGSGAAAQASLMLAEFAAVVIIVPLTRDPALAAAGMLLARAVGTMIMYRAMRRRAPWLSFGKPVGQPEVLRRLTKPALAATAFPTGYALNIQGTIVLVGIVLGPAAAAVFGTARTVSRIVAQVPGSIFPVVGPEFGKAYAMGDQDLIRELHRRSCHLAVWLCGPLLIVLAAVGPELISLWTSGAVEPERDLLTLLLVATGLDVLWLTSVGLLIFTNRHQRVGVIVLAVNLALIPVTYGLLQAMGLDGAAVALVGVAGILLAAVLVQTLPAADDTLPAWLRSLLPFPRVSEFRRLGQAT
jgi:O-antigen/teichoic acid export membrane protein